MQVNSTYLFGKTNTAHKPTTQYKSNVAFEALKPASVIKMQDIPKLAFLGKLGYTEKLKHVDANFDPKNTRRAVIVNDQDFFSLKETSVRHLTGVHPNVPLRTDEFVVTDTKIDPIIPDTSGDLIFPRDSLKFDQVNALVHASETAKMIDGYWGIKMPWAFEGPIKLDAHARFYNQGTGEYVETWDNAFYDRQGKQISLLIAENKREKGVVYASRSSDTIAHETSHAKLDGLNRYLGDSPCFITVGIHEAFADFNALLHSLCSDKIVDNVLKQTNGDLRKDNFASMFDIQFGKIVLSKEKSCLRSALNKYKNPDSLSELKFLPGKQGDLGLEPHIYSQLMVGTLYDALVEIYEKKTKEFDGNQKIALIKSREIIGDIFNRALLYMPTAEVNFKDLALAMIKVDQVEFEGANRETLLKVFKERNILKDKDIKEFDTQQKKLESLTMYLQQPIVPELERFVNENKDKFGISGDKELKFERILGDKDGNTFVKFVHDFTLAIPKERDVYFNLAGENKDLKEGITLVFNKNGKLVSSLSKEVNDSEKTQLLGFFKTFADYRYRPLQEGYDELADEWEAELKKREEERRKRVEASKKPDVPKPPKSTIHRYDI